MHVLGHRGRRVGPRLVKFFTNAPGERFKNSLRIQPLWAVMWVTNPGSWSEKGPKPAVSRLLTTLLDVNNARAGRLVPADVPRSVLIAAGLATVEGLALVGYAVLELLNIHGDRVALGLTTAAFFLAFGGGVVFCAVAMLRRQSWARSPIVLAQLVQLGVAWSFRGGETRLVSGGLAAVALVTLVAIFLPRSIRYLANE